MKKIIKCFAVAAMALAAVAACTEENPVEDNKNGTENNGGGENNGGENNGGETQKPELKEESLTAVPTGDTLTFNVVAEGAWEIYTEDEIDWVIVDPAEGLGELEVTFYVTANESGRDRSVSFFVKEGEYDIYEIFISQLKQELPIKEGDYNFLKDIVDRQLLGEETPEITDWYSFDGSGFPGITLGVDGAGKFFIEVIAGAPLVGWPTETVLEGLVNIDLRGMTSLAGCEMSEVWNTPKLKNICFANTGMTGVIPAGFAESSSELAQIFFDGCDFYGALPHTWSSEKLEVVILNTANNHAYKKDGDGNPILDENGNPIPNHQPQASHSPGLGYMVPASLDVIFNEDRTYQGDLTQMKLGGVCEGNYIGFEEGWGQARYERYDENAVAGDLTTWSEYRLLIGKPTGELDAYGRDLGQWPWYFSNLGHTGLSQCIPAKLLKWNQADADAYTAQCKAARGL